MVMAALLASAVVAYSAALDASTTSSAAESAFRIEATTTVTVALDMNTTSRGLPLLGLGNEMAYQPPNDTILAAAASAAGSRVARYPGGAHTTLTSEHHTRAHTHTLCCCYTPATW